MKQIFIILIVMLTVSVQGSDRYFKLIGRDDHYYNQVAWDKITSFLCDLEEKTSVHDVIDTNSVIAHTSFSVQRIADHSNKGWMYARNDKMLDNGLSDSDYARIETKVSQVAGLIVDYSESTPRDFLAQNNLMLGYTNFVTISTSGRNDTRTQNASYTILVAVLASDYVPQIAEDLSDVTDLTKTELVAMTDKNDYCYNNNLSKPLYVLRIPQSKFSTKPDWGAIQALEDKWSTIVSIEIDWYRQRQETKIFEHYNITKLTGE